MLNEPETLADQQGIENIVPIYGDARALRDHLPEPVDTILIVNTSRGIDDKGGFVQHAFESLQSDGRSDIVNWLDLSRETTIVAEEPPDLPTELRLLPAETEAIVREASGGQLVDHLELLLYHYALIFAQ